jgi:hypothetical protein
MASTRPLRAFAGAFSDLRETATVGTPALHARTTHQFTARSIRTRWDLWLRHSTARYTVDVRFPSSGPDAHITAVLRDGTRVPIGVAPMALAAVAWFEVRSQRTGYVVVPARMPARTTARALTPAPQSAAPIPGPTLTLQIARDRRFRHVGLAASLAVASTPAAARARTAAHPEGRRR